MVMTQEKNDLIEQRYANLKKLQEAGVDPFGEKFPDIQSVASVKEAFKEGGKCRIAGRVMSKREHGKTVFMDLKDTSGRMQLYAGKQVLGDEAFGLIKILDIAFPPGVRK